MFTSLALFRLRSSLFLAAHLPTFPIHLSTSKIHAILALVAGAFVLIRPKNLNIIVASYLLVLAIVLFFRLSF